MYNQEQEKVLKLWLKTMYSKEKILISNDIKELIFDKLSSWFEGCSFVTSNSKDFKAFLEDSIGVFEFTKPISMKLSSNTLLFINGVLVYSNKKNIWKEEEQ